MLDLSRNNGRQKSDTQIAILEVARYPSTRRNYTDEFKAQTVALEESVGRTEAARQLLMPVKTLDNWVGAMRWGRPLSSPDRTSLLHSCSPSIPPDLPCTRLSNQRQISGVKKAPKGAFSEGSRSSRSDPLTPSLATLGSESDRLCPSSLLQRNQHSLLPKLRGGLAGTQSQRMRSCSPRLQAYTGLPACQLDSEA